MENGREVWERGGLPVLGSGRNSFIEKGRGGLGTFLGSDRTGNEDGFRFTN